MSDTLEHSHACLACELGAFARLIYNGRRVRDSAFGSIFGEPSWDILLDLFASEMEGKTVRVSSACIASAVPATTGHRHLTQLQRLGLVVRSASGTDGRAQYVTLTDAGRSKMARLLLHLRAAQHDG